MSFFENSLMNIAMISYYYYPEYSGSAKQASGLIKELAKNGIKSFIITARQNRKWPEHEFLDGIEVIRVPVRNRKSLFRFWFGVAWVLWKYRRKIDIVHSHGMNPLHGFSLFWAKLLKIPSVGKLSIAKSDIDFKNQGRLIGKIHKWFLKKSDLYISISSEMTQEVERSGLDGSKCVFLPNGVDRNRFFPVSSVIRKRIREDLTFSSNEFLILFVGVIDYRKGVDILLSAFKEVAPIYSNAKLILVGPLNRDDVDRKFYNSMVNLTVKFGIQNQVEFRNTSHQVEKYYQCADLFVLPSRNEGMPNVVLEAMSCGLPIVGTRISGTTDLIDDSKNGLIVEKNDYQDLAEKIKLLIDNKNMLIKMGKKSIEYVRRKYDLQLIGKEYSNIYRKLLKEVD